MNLKLDLISFVLYSNDYQPLGEQPFGFSRIERLIYQICLCITLHRATSLFCTSPVKFKRVRLSQRSIEVLSIFMRSPFLCVSIKKRWKDLHGILYWSNFGNFVEPVLLSFRSDNFITHFLQWTICLHARGLASLFCACLIPVTLSSICKLGK